MIQYNISSSKKSQKSSVDFVKMLQYNKIACNKYTSV